MATVEATAAGGLAAGDAVGAVTVVGSDGVGVITAFAAVAAAVRCHRRHSCVRRDGAVRGDDAAHRLPLLLRHRAAAEVPITFEKADYVILLTKSFINYYNNIIVCIQLNGTRINRH